MSIRHPDRSGRELPGTRRLGFVLVSALLMVSCGGGDQDQGSGGAGSGGPVSRTNAHSDPRSIIYPTRTMGTYGTITLTSEDSLKTLPLAEAAHHAFHHVDSLMSNWTETSEVARLNHEAGERTVTVDPEVSRVLDAALRIGDASEGAFDVTVEPLVRLWGFMGGRARVPDESEIAAVMPRVGRRQIDFDAETRALHFRSPDVRIDLGGIAKGYGVDAAVEVLRALGVASALVDISGNMYALGHPAGRDHWVIGIRDPRNKVPYIGRLVVTDRAVATSGVYEQFVARDGRIYGHIIDPRTGHSAEGLIAVTVVAPSGMDADAWGTALFVLGPEAGRRVAASRADVSALLVEPGAQVDTIWVEEALREVFELESSSADRFRVIYF